MLHQHLTVAFRALDSKWGEPVDLDTTEETRPCIPAVLEKPATTFSSEEYLITIKRRRATPYSREERKVRRSKVKDSFSNISLARYNSTSELGGSVSSLDSCQSAKSTNNCDDLVKEIKSLVDNLKKPLNSEEKSSKESSLKRKKEELENTFKNMKNRAILYVEKKYRGERT